MVNTISEIIEEHTLMAIFLVCLSAIILSVLKINSEYTSTPYYSEIVKCEIAIISIFIVLALTAILTERYKH